VNEEGRRLGKNKRVGKMSIKGLIRQMVSYL
jgi:hypothetical protein